jgi:uncharacterized lipoprotein YehR (DUF1307 family)
MVNKLTLVSVLLILMLAVSGCTDSSKNNKENGLPEGYEYLGDRSISIDKVISEYISIDGIVGASESLYKYSDVDLYVDTIEMENSEVAEDFIVQYKAEFKQMTDDTRFTDVSFNDHSAVAIKQHVVIGNEQVPRYSYIWSSGNFVYVLSGSTSDIAILQTLAESTEL